ncbi:MAG: hypothetical protein KDC05_17040, partial [Bacteroidales bacterium]|nr:hypothetical protein [Bacteroidales bacterium]
MANTYTTGTQTLSTGDWTMVAVFQEASSASYGGTGHAARINDDVAGAQLTTPALNTIGTVSFYYRELNSGGGTFELLKSYDGTNWISVTTQAYAGNTFTLFTYDVNDNASTVYIRILSNDNAGHLIIDEYSVTNYAGGPTPQIIASDNELFGFSYIEGSGPSNELSFTVEGTDLTDDITVTAPTNYMVSLTMGSGYSSALVLAESAGSVSTTTIYARLNAGLSGGFYNEDITATSSGATDKTVTCNGKVLTVQSLDYSEDFETASGTGSTPIGADLVNWTNLETTGNVSWTSSSFSGNTYASMSSFGSGEANISWLISPPL